MLALQVLGFYTTLVTPSHVFLLYFGARCEQQVRSSVTSSNFLTVASGTPFLDHRLEKFDAHLPISAPWPVSAMS